MRLLYNFASRSRKDKFFATLDNIISFSRHKDYLILCTLDVDDPVMATEQVKDQLATYQKVKAYWGISKNKVDAINKSLPFAGEFDILINMSDDMEFIKEGFDLDIIADMQANFPDTDGVLHYPDNNVGIKLMTLSILGRKYFDRFGYVYHPDYMNVYCDNEETDKAKILGKYMFVNKRLFNHNHPMFGKGKMDDQYKKTENPQGYKKDHETYLRRKANNFNL